MKRSLPSSRRYLASKRVYCPHCSMQVQRRTYDEHRRNFYDEVAKQWNNTKDDTHHDGSESDVTTQSSEPNSDIEISSPDEYISSPDISDMYAGLDGLTDMDRDEIYRRMHKKVQMKSIGTRVMKIMKKIGIMIIIHRQNHLFDGWWHFSLHFKLHMQSLIWQLIGCSHFFIRCSRCCIQFVLPHSFVLL